MALPSPHLDDRPFQMLVDDAKRKIALRCPEWTEHNVSDPGITLIELFASMFEMTLYRVNQVPELHQVRFLELLGLGLEPPHAAQTELRFRLSAPLANTDQEVRLPARITQAGTPRTEDMESIEFVTDVKVVLRSPELRAVLAIAADADLANPASAKALALREVEGRDASQGFSVYSSVPKAGDGIYFGFAPGIERHIVGLDVEPVNAAATGLNERYPSQVWEYWEATGGAWKRADLADDPTFGFSQRGRIEIVVPNTAGVREVAGVAGLWIRARYTIDPEDLPPLGIGDARIHPSEYRRSPEILGVAALTVGGQIPATNCAIVTNEPLGLSDGLPGQTFRLRENPILDPGYEDVVITGASGEDGFTLVNPVAWERKPDFSRSGPNDLHVTIDTLRGEIAFGPNLRLPEGGARQYGAIPPKGHAVRMTSYRYGGGSGGNVREDRIRTLRQAIPYIASVSNPYPAKGGSDLESMDHAKMRVRELLHTRERAVTAEDFEMLAHRSAAAVGRARCVFPATDGEPVPPGTVRVLLVPRLGPEHRRPAPRDLSMPDSALREVRAFLDERRLLTTRLELVDPTYRYVSVQLRLVSDPQADPDAVRDRVVERLDAFLHPLTGGPDGGGWPFRRKLTLADVYAQVANIRGVAILRDARLFVSEVEDATTNALSAEQPVNSPQGLRLGEGELICTREHRVTVVPMTMAGSDLDEDAREDEA